MSESTFVDRISATSRSIALFALVLLWIPLRIVPAAQPGKEQAAEKAADEQLLADLKAAWKARTGKFDSVRFRWDEEREYHTGSIIPGPFAKAHDIEKVHPVLGFPVATTTTKLPREIVLTGNCMRHVSKSIGPSEDGLSLKQTDHLAVYDGISSRMMSIDGKRIHGSIRNEDQNTDAGSSSFLPLLYFMRPLNPRNGKVKAASLKLVSRNEEDGTMTVEANAMKRFVVDPRRGFIVLRWEIGNPINGGNLYQGHVEYEQHESLSWVPKKGDIERYDFNVPNLLLEKDQATITHIEAGVDYDSSLFRVEFPIGAQVWNAHIREEFVVTKRDDPRIAYETP